MKYKKIKLEIDYKKAELEHTEEYPFLECYIPDDIFSEKRDSVKRNNTILILPGGGYKSTSLREHEPIALQFLAAGFSVFLLRYSVNPNIFPKALYEVYSAIKMIRKYADEWLVDTDRISVCGFSAGGHLAASAGTFWDEDFVKKALDVTTEHKPNSLVLCYPVITAGEYAHKGSFKNLLGKENISDEEIAYFSLENQISNKFPSSFVWHTAEDKSVPVMNSLLLCEQLAKNDITFELHIYPKGGHGLALSNHITQKPNSVTPPEKPRVWVKDAIDFLEKTAYNINS